MGLHFDEKKLLKFKFLTGTLCPKPIPIPLVLIGLRVSLMVLSPVILTKEITLYGITWNSFIIAKYFMES